MEKKINIDPFTVGEPVVCVETNSTNRLIIGNVYVVTGTEANCKCGITINVNNQQAMDATNSPVYRGMLVNCSQCGCDYISDGIQYYLQRRFRKIAEQKAPMLTFEKIKEDESVKEREEKEILILN